MAYKQNSPISAVEGATGQNSYATGDILYASAANTLSKLTAGSDTEVLTLAAGVPTWAAPAGGGGAWTYISSATASNSASVSFTDLSSTYSSYLVQVIDVIPVDNGRFLAMRTSSNNGASYDSGSSNYRYSGVGSGSALYAGYSTGSTYIIFNPTFSQGNDTNEFASLNVQILSPSSTNYTTVQAVFSTVNTSGLFLDTRMSGQRQSAAAVDAIQFFYLSGNISVGTFRLYGLSAT